MYAVWTVSLSHYTHIAVLKSQPRKHETDGLNRERKAEQGTHDLTIDTCFELFLLVVGTVGLIRVFNCKSF